MPASTFSSVDFPTPFGPTTPRHVPGPMVNETFVSTGSAPRSRHTSRQTRVALVDCGPYATVLDEDLGRVGTCNLQTVGS